MTFHATTGWTDERITALKQHWLDGLSGGQIAAALGITRNAVIGKIRRLGLLGLPRPPKREAKPKRAYHRRVVFYPGRKPANGGEVEVIEEEACDLPPDTSPDACTLMQLTEETCRWPLGEPTHDMQYCGSQRWGEGSYCRRHARLAYMPRPLRTISPKIAGAQ